MMSFCKKTVHSLLGLTTITNSMDPDTTNPFDKSPYKHNASLGIGLITATGETLRPPNVIESSFLKQLPSPPSSPPPLVLSLPSMFAKKDPGGRGFIDEMGGGVNGLMSCTESLGFESSDERTDNDHHHHQIEMDTRVESPTRKKGRRDVSDRREIKKFPPPLSSFNRNGQPAFFLRSVRSGGRLELTEIRVDRPEILRASREDGRLRLHLIRNDDDLEPDSKIEEEQEQEEEEVLQQETIQEEEEELEEEKMVREWQLPVSGEVLRRCNEVRLSSHHHHHQNISHHHSLHVWRQHCVPTR